MSAAKPFRPMLARPAGKGEQLPLPMLGSVKLDGIRCLVIDGKPMSRKLLQLPNAQLANYLAWHELEGLDGELIVGPPNAPDAYNRTVSAVMADDRPLDGLVFWVFDLHRYHDDCDPYEDRQDAARYVVEQVPGCYRSRIASLPCRSLSTPDEVAQAEAQAVERGFEGLMLRDPAGLYKYGRTSSKEYGLLKLKRFEDSEAEILAIHPLMRNGNELLTNELGLAKRSTHAANKVPDSLLGKIDVRDIATGVEFSIGSGFDDATKRQMWAERDTLIGKMVKYKYQPAGVKEAPRFPVFLGMRDVRDLSK